MSDRPATACVPPEVLKLSDSGLFPLLFCNLEICSRLSKTFVKTQPIWRAVEYSKCLECLHPRSKRPHECRLGVSNVL